MRQRDEDHTFLHPRIRAIEVPCPCSAVSPRVASILSTGGLTVIYLMWAIGVWKGYFEINKLKAFVRPSSTAFVEMRNMATYSLIAAWYFSTSTLLAFGSFIVSIFPRQEVAKHLSRSVWIGWGVTWIIGIYGIAAHLSADAWVVAGCDRGEACEGFRRQLQIGLIAALFVSLALIFWFAIVFSAFVHTLHPHLFYHGDVDPDLDDYDHACILEEELRHSEHPLAGEALEWLQSERAKGTFTATVPPDKIRARRSFRAESEESGSESELEEEKDRKSLIPTRSQETTSRSRTITRQSQRHLTDIMSDSEESGSMSEPERGRPSEKRVEKELGRSSRSVSRSKPQSRGRSRSSRR